MAREYGRAPIGQRVCLPKSGRRTKKLNIMAGLLNGNLLCPAIYDWTTNSAWFLEWLQCFLFPLLNVGSVIILDNASFHKKYEVHCIAASFGCHAIFLPPYSPDKNKIEKSWANLKNWLRLNSKKYKNIWNAIIAFFKTE